MSVDFARPAVRSPAGVGDTEVARKGNIRQIVGQQRDLAGVLAAAQDAVGDNRHAHRIVATVLQALEAFEQNGRYIPLRGGGNDAAHQWSSFFGGRRQPGMLRCLPRPIPR